MAATLNIGLLMTRNERDVIEEVMTANRGCVDTIFALDGSTDGTDRILASYPEVELLLRDDQVAPDGRVRDYHRQVLLDAAHARYGHGHWFTLLHGDEIFYDDPRAVIAAAEAQGAQRVNWAVMQFFLHPDDAPGKTACSNGSHRSVQERIRWYSPFWIEIRQFRSGPRTRYRRRHGQVVPDGVGLRPYGKMPILKHYPYRSPEQMQARARDAAERGFSGTAQGNAPTIEIYRRRYGPEYLLARHFDGDFGELEIERQGNLLTMWWRWKRWVQAGKRKETRSTR